MPYQYSYWWRLVEAAAKQHLEDQMDLQGESTLPPSIFRYVSVGVSDFYWCQHKWFFGCSKGSSRLMMNIIKSCLYLEIHLNWCSVTQSGIQNLKSLIKFITWQVWIRDPNLKSHSWAPFQCTPSNIYPKVSCTKFSGTSGGYVLSRLFWQNGDANGAFNV